MAEKQNTPQPQNTTNIDTDVFVKGMTKDPNASLVGKDQWTHARNAINNSKDGDIGTLGNEPANKLCGSAPFTIIGAIHLYGDKWVLFSTNNEQSEIGTWDDSECKYERLVNDYSCYMCADEFPNSNPPFMPCLNFNTQYLITGAAKENFDCSWQIYWDDGLNPSRTLNLDNIPWHQRIISEKGADCVIYEDMEPLCIDCEKLRLAPLVDIPCVELSKSADGGQLRNGSYQIFIAYVINDQVVGDYYGISNIQSLFDHEDMLSGLEVKISNLDTNFEYYQLVVCSFNQGEQQAKKLGFYSTNQTNISIDYINQKLQSIPIDTLPITTPAYERTEKMYVVNDYLVRQGPTEQFDFNYQPLANQIHTHWTITQFPSDYYAKGGNKTTFMRDEVYSFFIRFIYNTGEKSASYHIPGRAPYNWTGITDAAGANPNVLDPWPGNNDLGTASWVQNGSVGTQTADRLFEVHNTADDGWTITLTEDNQTDDGGTIIREGHMGYWESTERYPNDPVRWNGISGDPNHDLCGKPIRHHKMPDETTAWQELVTDPSATVTPNNYMDRSSGDANGNPNQFINVLGVKFSNIAWPRYNQTTEDECGPEDGRPTGNLIPNIVGYEILVGSREGNKSIIAKGIARNMRQYNIPPDASGHETVPGTDTGYIANYPFNDCNADPYLQGGNDWTYNSASSTVLNNNTYGPGSTATNIFTFHSPETSFNKPYLSPYELKSYGICTGTQSGRFKPSEKHPQHKLLRNLSMWIAIIVGVGYAIQEMRGRRKLKYMPPKSLELGLSGQGDAHSGGGNYNETVIGAGGGALGTGGWSLNGSGMGNWNRGGGAWTEAAPSSNSAGGLMTAQNATMMTDYNTSFNLNTRETGLTTATVFGAPKVWHNLPGAMGVGGYQSTMRTAMGSLGSGRGRIGAGQEIEFQGSRYESAPSLTQLLFGVYNFMAFTATGGQEIIDLIYNLVSYQDYAWKYNGHGLYWATQQRVPTDPFRQIIDKARYIGSSMQNLTANIKINNIQRPSTVVVSTVTNGGDFTIPIMDNSKFIIGNNPSPGTCHWWNPGGNVVANIAAHYCAIKVAFRNQYGQLDQIKQVPSGCITYFDDQRIRDEQGDIVPWTYEITYDENGNEINNATNFQTPTIYGGDCYLNRYSEKVIMPFFWDFLKGQPDGFPYDYKLRANVPRPVYWMDTKKFELSQLVRQIVSFGFITGNSSVADAMPSGLYFLDREGADRIQDTHGGATNTSGGTWQDAGGPSTTPTPIAGQSPTSDQGGRSLFHIKNGYMYTHCNGVNEFFVESTINTALRDWEDVDEKRHYDWLEYTDVEALFDVDIIRKDNFYKYDSSLSKGRFFSQLISFGFIQPRDYDPIVADKCYTHYPKRLIYSLQAQLEAKKDFWKVFLPLNYKDFKNRVNVIKPVSKSGAMILFPHLAPTMWQGVDQLETDLGTKLTIGDGGLFSQPMQNVVNTDVSHEYGSCESARSVVNTPSGLFYISQAQGKIFKYTQKGLENIANKGMKQWFNKYLPSFLLAQYPEMEQCSNWVDNPVAGIGCQSVYDPNYDLIYFTKKDYNCTLPECIDYIPCEGFVYNNTNCNNVAATPCCPDGYTYNPSNPVGEECEKITIVPAIEDQEGGQVDIVFVVDASNSVDSNQNIGNMQNFLKVMIDQLSTQIGNGDVRIGLVHFGGGRCTSIPLSDHGQTAADCQIPADCPQCSNPDPFMNAGEQQTLTSDMTLLTQWVGTPGATFDWQGGGTGYEPDLMSIYGITADRGISSGNGTLTTGLGGGNDDPFGTDIIGGIWNGQNLLYGTGSRQVPKVLITLFDGGQVAESIPLMRANGGPGVSYVSSSYTAGGITGSDIYQSMTVSPVTPDVVWPGDPPFSTVWNTGGYECTWFNSNVLNNSQYTNTPYIQKNYSVVVDPGGNPPSQNPHIDYAEEFANVGNAYGGSFADVSEIETVATEIIDDVTPPPTYSCADPTCDLVQNSAQQWMCECREYLPAEFIDNTTPVTLDDERYFEDVSWTVSYDPKYEAWMSFHDWHPELVIPSLNHFFTTNSYEDLEAEPNCPPGFIWNPTTQTCCQTFQGSYEADIIVDEVPVVFSQDVNACNLDIAIGLDLSGSNFATQGHVTGNAFISSFLTALDARMDGSITGVTGANIAQVGLYTWTSLDGNCSGGVGNNVQVSPMSTNAAVLNAFTQGNGPNQGLLQGVGGGDEYDAAVPLGMTNLNNYASSTLGDRSGSTNYRRILIILTDANTPTACSSGICFSQNMPVDVWGQGVETIAVKLEATDPVSMTIPTSDAAWPIVSCIVQSNTDAYRAGPSQGAILGNQIADSLCVEPPICICPDGYTRISSTSTGTAPPHVVLGPNDNCYIEGKNGVCRKMECECDPSNLPVPTIPVTQTGFCPTDIYPNGIAEWYNQDTGVGDPLWTNPDPRMCHYDYECCLDGTFTKGGIWKHNDRCDLYANYYGDNYPWEVEWVESVGQAVNTIRSVEYQLESYIYRGSLDNNCGDRFHDLDWNFDHAIIHNTEQVSGELALTLDPKNNVPLITQFPFITGNEIRILYSKVEQKYRFNQFWDITNDRGEFDPNANLSIFITQLNGYIRDLNQANLDYNKPQLQRKKFRHYWNKVILRKNISADRKMILKLANTKINASFR